MLLKKLKIELQGLFTSKLFLPFKWWFLGATIFFHVISFIFSMFGNLWTKFFFMWFFWMLSCKNNLIDSYQGHYWRSWSSNSKFLISSYLINMHRYNQWVCRKKIITREFFVMIFKVPAGYPITCFDFIVFDNYGTMLYQAKHFISLLVNYNDR
jgi:hypothetical protein